MLVLIMHNDSPGPVGYFGRPGFGVHYRAVGGGEEEDNDKI